MTIILLSNAAATAPPAALSPVQDHFDRPNSTDPGPNWTVINGGARIYNHQLNADLGLGKIYWNANSFGNDQWVQAVIYGAPGDAWRGLTLRGQGTTDADYKAYAVYWSNTISPASLAIGWINGTGWGEYLVGTTAANLNSGDVLRFRVTGQDPNILLEVYVNGTLVKSAAQANFINPAAILSSGQPGVFFFVGFEADHGFDDFQAWDQPLSYLLYDDFTDTRAAGAVDDTDSTPPDNVALTGATPTRTVVDSGPYLSVAPNALAITGLTAAGDPRLIYPSVVRTFGRTFLGRHNNAGSVQVVEPGFHQDASSDPQHASFFFYTSSLLYGFANGTFTARLSAGLSNSANYFWAVVQRASGCYLLIRDTTGTFPTWHLLWADDRGSASPLYPVWSVGNGGVDEDALAGALRIPDDLFTDFPVLAYDTFTRGDGVLGSSETTGPDGQTLAAKAWTAQNGTLEIDTNQAAVTALGSGTAYATVDSGSPDVIIDLDLTRSAGSAGIIARYQDASNYLVAYTDGTNVKLDQVVAGTPTTLISDTRTYGAGYRLRLTLDGTLARLCYFNPASPPGYYGDLDAATVPASTYGAHGLYGTDTSARFDSFTVWPRGSDNEFAWLNGY